MEMQGKHRFRSPEPIKRKENMGFGACKTNKTQGKRRFRSPELIKRKENVGSGPKNK